jgi:hypothetical protein
MDKIKDFVANVLVGNNAEAKNVFNEMISEISLERLNERKTEIAQNLFKTEEPVIEEESVEEGALGAALGSGAGAMLGGPVGAALGGYLGHKTGDMAPGLAKKTGRVLKKVAGIGGGAVVGGALGGPLGALGGGYLGHRMTKEELDALDEKAKSPEQQKFMGMVYAAKKGEKAASPEVARAAAGMTTKQAREYAATKHAELPKQEGWFGGDDKTVPPPKPEPKQPPAAADKPNPTVGGAMDAMKNRQKMLQDI